VRSQAALALWRIERHPAAIPALVTVVKEDDFGRLNAALALGQIGPEAKLAIPALVAALDDEGRLTRVEVACALWRINKHPAAIPALLKVLKERERGWRRQAAEALGRLGPGAKAAVPALVEALWDDDESVRQRAAQSLKRIDPEAAKKAGVK
jgi:HEAT repeat protein